MANEQIKNAVKLMSDPDFNSWVTVGLVFQAKSVMTESASTDNHAARLALAEDVLVEPENQNIVRRMINVLAVDLDICSKGTVDTIGQDLLLEKIDFYWDHIAEMVHPAPVE